MTDKLVIPDDLREEWEYADKHCYCCLDAGRQRAYIERIARAEQQVADLTTDRDHFQTAWATELRKHHEYMNALTDCQRKIAELEAALERMKQPVSDEEWQDFGQPFSGVFASIQRDGVDRIIAARAAAPERSKDGQ